jgi:two-component system cell cycle sensor histidine kinase/response regulator CckA
MPRRLPHPAAVALLALVYFSSAKLGLLAAVAHGVVSSAWPPTGVALAALLLGGVRYWPGIAIGAFLLNATAGVSVAGAAGIAVGNTLEAVIGALLLQRMARFLPSLERLQDVFALGVAAALSTAVGATIGLGSLWLSGAIGLNSLGPLWFVWWSGDAIGALVVAPAILTWSTTPLLREPLRRAAEALVLLLMLVLVTAVLFRTAVSYVYAIFPIASWAALRFGPRGAATATFLVSSLAVWHTLHGLGPFVTSTPTHNLALLQTFIALLALTTLLLAARTSERNAAERAVTESEGHYRILFEGHPHPLWVYDRETLAFLAANEAAVRHYGYTREEFLRMTLEDIRPPEDVEKLREHRRKSGEGLHEAGEWRHRKKDGTIIDVAITRHTLSIGERRAALAMAQDVTKRKVLESQLLQAQKMEAVGQLAGGIAHDFNNLLTATLACCDLLTEELRSARNGAQELVQEIRAAAQRAASLTGQLLAFSRKQILQPKLLDVNAVLVGLESLLRRLICEDVEIRLVLAPGPKPVFADPNQLEQVVINLAVNARDAMPSGGPLTIETAVREISDADAQTLGLLRSGKVVALTVRDTGTGMDAETLRRIFEPFYTTKEPGRGTGLGLSMVHGFVRQSGGAVEVDSELGRGSAFTVLLPWERRANPEARAAANGRRSAAGGTETILLVDDETAISRPIGRFLQAEGYVVLTAATPEEALRIFQDHGGRIDLLLTDVVLPGSGGIALAAAIQKTEAGLRVLYMSGHTESDLIRRGVSSDSLAFLAKPFSLAELGAAVREVLDR